jgi:hypothetical protein
MAYNWMSYGPQIHIKESAQPASSYKAPYLSVSVSQTFNCNLRVFHIEGFRSNLKMPAKYAKDQPAGYKNHLENVAIVGVSNLLNPHLK